MSVNESHGSAKPPSMRTPLGRVRSLGSSHSGTRDFWRQRITAVAMTLLIVPVIVVVMTLLSRLYDKGLVGRRRQGRGYAYRPRVSQSQYQARVMSTALRRDVDVPEVLLHFVGDLTPKEQATLRGLLKDGA